MLTAGFILPRESLRNSQVFMNSASGICIFSFLRMENHGWEKASDFTPVVRVIH
jgi:hypothetical protein